MKKNIALILLLVLSLHVLAQNKNHIIRVDWKAIEKTVKTRPDSVKALVARFVQPQIDTTLTLPERILAYYGQSYISNGSEALDVMQMEDSLKVKSAAALRLAEKALTKNPLNADALIGKASILLKRLETNPDDSAKVASEARYCLRIMMQIYDVIGSTGDGTAENPFSVTSVSDEYNFLHYYLEIWKVTGQALIMSGKNKVACEVLHLAEKSNYWDKPDIYFDVTRVLLLEEGTFK